MRFAVYLPPQARQGPVPAVVYLAGLTCTEETFTIKAGAQRVAAELGLALLMPDTSPRGAKVPGEADAWDFGGSLVDLEAARMAVALPVLRKEFIVDRYQVVEARAHGADAVLLIAECLDDCHLRSLYREIIDFGMTPLVELHDEDNLPRVLDLGATLVGVNNRNLKTMTTDLDHVLRLRARVPADVVLVAESGIKTRADVERLEAAGIGAMLVGESLLKASDPGRAAAALLGCVT